MTRKHKFFSGKPGGLHVKEIGRDGTLFIRKKWTRKVKGGQKRTAENRNRYPRLANSLAASFPEETRVRKPIRMPSDGIKGER